MPLAGIVGLFPTSYERFSLAYAESVAAVDFFIRTYGKDKLVQLITSYRGGVTDDEAFIAATGSDFAAFDAACVAAQGASVTAAIRAGAGRPRARCRPTGARRTGRDTGGQRRRGTLT